MYVPSGKLGADLYKKVYAKISADFYIDKAGDHSVYVFLSPEETSSSVASTQRSMVESTTSFNQLMDKVR